MSFKSFSRYTVAGLLTLTASYALAVPMGSETVFSVETLAEDIDFGPVTLTLDKHDTGSPPGSTLTSASYRLFGDGTLRVQVSSLAAGFALPDDAEVLASFTLNLVGHGVDSDFIVEYLFPRDEMIFDADTGVYNLEQEVPIDFDGLIPDSNLADFEGPSPETVTFNLYGIQNKTVPDEGDLQSGDWGVSTVGTHAIEDTKMSITYNWGDDGPTVPPTVPAPGAVVLLGIGLLGLGAVRRRRTA